MWFANHSPYSPRLALSLGDSPVVPRYLSPFGTRAILIFAEKQRVAFDKVTKM